MQRHFPIMHLTKIGYVAVIWRSRLMTFSFVCLCANRNLTNRNGACCRCLEKRWKKEFLPHIASNHVICIIKIFHLSVVLRWLTVLECFTISDIFFLTVPCDVRMCFLPHLTDGKQGLKAYLHCPSTALWKCFVPTLNILPPWPEIAYLVYSSHQMINICF